MGKLNTKGSPISNTYAPSVNAPFDDRITVNKKTDLTDGVNGIAALVYTGMVVYVHEEKTLYVYTGSSNKNYVNTKTGAPLNGGLESNWKKVSSDVNPSDFGASIVESVDDLDNVENAYQGMLAVVKDDLETSENEGGLYILVETEPEKVWQKVTSSPSAESGDTTHVITVDGTIPTSGSGISINNNDEEGYVSENYVDSGFEEGKYYTSRGLNSSIDNGGSDDYSDVEYIILSNGGDSYIKLFTSGDNWAEIHLVDDSLGITMDDVKFVAKDENGNDAIYPMVDDTITLKNEQLATFGDLDFTGMTEKRYPGDDTEYVFGSTGSGYDDIDVYTVNTIPTIYAYSDGEPVRILTEVDRVEIIKEIEPKTVTEEQILSLFNFQ